jgi:hypothetical protein
MSSGDVEADGLGTVTVNSLGPGNHLVNNGTFSNISSFLSGGSTMHNSGNWSWAWDIVGANNSLATTGKFSVAGAFSQADATVVQDGPGGDIKYRNTVGSRSRNNSPKVTATRVSASGPNSPGPISTDGGKPSVGHSAKAHNRG